MKNPQISIITVGMNHLPYLKTLLNSLYNLARPHISFEMIYVDNCSTDGSVNFIKTNYPSVRIIENKIPLGFGANNNNGAAIASGKYFALINPDITILPDSLDILFRFAESLDFETIIAPKLLNPDKSLQYSVRGFINPSVFILRLITKGNDKIKNQTVENYLCRNINTERIQYINWAIGAALFIKSSLYQKLNGFDTDYFMYMEDADICLRSWQIKSPVIYNPESKMIHNHLRGSSKLGRKTFIHIKSILIFFRKHGVYIKDYSQEFSIRSKSSSNNENRDAQESYEQKYLKANSKTIIQ
jgi:Predicted glycosyltransferases